MYLAVQDMFGLSLVKNESNEVDDIEAEDCLLNKIGDTVKLNAGFDALKKTFTDRKYLENFALLLEIAIVFFLCTNCAMLVYGSN